MTKYEIMYEALQEKVNSGELTVEDAEILNDIAYERYAEDMTEYTESSDNDMTYDEYLESMEEDLFGESTRLGREIRNKTHKFYDDMDDDFKNSKINKDKNKNLEAVKNYMSGVKNLNKFAKNGFLYDSKICGEIAAEDKKNNNKIDFILDKNAGKIAKNILINKYDLLPSDKSLENKSPNKYLNMQKKKNRFKKFIKK